MIVSCNAAGNGEVGRNRDRVLARDPYIMLYITVILKSVGTLHLNVYQDCVPGGRPYRLADHATRHGRTFGKYQFFYIN